MKQRDILKALAEGSIPYTRLLTGTGEDDWTYIKIDVDSLKQELQIYPWNKIIPCTLSSYKTALWFEIGARDDSTM